jgi:hypothetical protein
MERNLKQEREDAHKLLDLLPPEKIAAVRGLLEVMVEPLSSPQASATEDEPEVAPGVAAAIERARASLRKGEGISHEEILREFGLNK